MLIRMCARGVPAFRHDGLSVDSSWREIDVDNPVTRATLLEHGRRFVTVHPSDIDKTVDVGLGDILPELPSGPSARAAGDDIEARKQAVMEEIDAYSEKARALIEEQEAQMRAHFDAELADLQRGREELRQERAKFEEERAKVLGDAKSPPPIGVATEPAIAPIDEKSDTTGKKSKR